MGAAVVPDRAVYPFRHLRAKVESSPGACGARTAHGGEPAMRLIGFAATFWETPFGPLSRADRMTVRHVKQTPRAGSTARTTFAARRSRWRRRTAKPPSAWSAQAEATLASASEAVAASGRIRAWASGCWYDAVLGPAGSDTAAATAAVAGFAGLDGHGGLAQQVVQQRQGFGVFGYRAAVAVAVTGTAAAVTRRLLRTASA